MPTITDLKISQIANYVGLNSADAQLAQKQYGLNLRPVAKRKTWLHRLWDIFTEPMMFLILATGVLYFFFHDWVEAVIILASIIPIGLIEFIQEGRTDKAIEVLDKFMVQYVLVYRDGKLQKMESKYLVPGDVVHLTAGDKIPADGVLINSPGLTVDESILTGESVTVVKAQLVNHDEIKDENILYQGTMIAQGEGQQLVLDTGVNTKYGKLGALLESIEGQKTPLQKKIHKLVNGVAVVAFITAVLTTVLVGWSRGVMEGVLAGLTMAMSLIPEEFPVVFSVFLILGVLRLAKEKALTRKMVMVETLGSATVICTDKTGTLTEGSMSLEQIYFSGKIFDVKKTTIIKNEFSDLITASLLALERVAVDPIEVEMQDFARVQGLNPEEFYSGYTLKHDAPFDAKTKMVHHIWQNNDTKKCAQYSVGAPESVFGCCEFIGNGRAEVLAINDKLAGDGYRVIAVAQKETDCSDRVELSGLRFVGLLVMRDPVRAGVKDAIRVCQEAGIRVVMITGDNKLTAHNVAESLGMKHNEEMISGDEFAELTTEGILKIVKSHDIFARIRPEQKFMIVEALQKQGEVVAMTGDGVNDAPALKKADIGIAMGSRGTEVARAAAGMVLLDDNFSTIVDAVKEGRRIYDNMRKAFMFLFSFHLPIIGLAVVPLLFNQPMIFMPIHIIFLELICDPASVLGFERDHARLGLLQEPPRPVSEPLINPKLWWQIIVQGVAILAVSLGFYYYGVRLGGAELGRTLAFSALVVSQVALILLTREWVQVKSNFLLLFIAVATLVALVALLTVPFARGIFHFAPISWALVDSVILIPFAVMGAVSLVVRK